MCVLHAGRDRFGKGGGGGFRQYWQLKLVRCGQLYVVLGELKLVCCLS